MMLRKNKSETPYEINEKETQLSNLLFNNAEDFAARLKPDEQEVTDIKPKPVWADDDDDDADNFIKTKSKVQYKDRLKRKYETLIGTPSWAKLDKKPKLEEDEDDNGIQRSVGHLQKKKSQYLPKDNLHLKRYPILKAVKHTVTCLQFHPTASVALIGGNSGDVSLYSVGDKENKLLHSFRLAKMKLSRAYFTPNGSEAYIFNNKNNQYCVYDLMQAKPKLLRIPQIKRISKTAMSPNGKYVAISAGFDEVYLISTASKELLRIMKNSEQVKSVCFNNESNKLYCYCKDGQISIWDLKTYKVTQKFYDQGCVTASCVAASPCGRLLAVGSGEGIVNIYETANLNTSNPVPVKTITNLTTRINNMEFNASTEILAVSSTSIKNAVKLIHIPSYHVFANFPQPDILDLSQVQSVVFSTNSGYMAVGNNKGTVFLYRITHYKNY